MPDIITIGMFVGIIVGLYIVFTSPPSRGIGKKFYGSFAKLNRLKKNI